MARAAVERRQARVDGAPALLQHFHEAVETGTAPGLAAARALVQHAVDWRAARAIIEESQRGVVLGEHSSGSVLAGRFFPPGEPTPIHDHGYSGAALVVEGHNRYERFQRTGSTTAQLESIHHLATGDVTWWNAPLDDLHRQLGLDGGAIELVLIAGLPTDVIEYADCTPSMSDLHAVLVEGYLAGDVAALQAHYHPDVLVDANVPEWRFQLRGRRSAMDLFEHEEFDKRDRRVTFLRPTETTDGLLLETESRFVEDGELRVCRETHNLRIRHGLVVEHVVWCTGVAYGSTARKQFETAPMERP